MRKEAHLDWGSYNYTVLEPQDNRKTVEYMDSNIVSRTLDMTSFDSFRISRCAYDVQSLNRASILSWYFNVKYEISLFGRKIEKDSPIFLIKLLGVRQLYQRVTKNKLCQFFGIL